MAKKKKRLPPVAELPQVTEEQLKAAKTLILKGNTDLSYHLAKRKIEKELGYSRAESNAVVVRLYEEGFCAGERNFFCHPDSPVEYGVVRGARELDRFTLMLQNNPDEELPLKPGYQFLPGDVVEVRSSCGHWRVTDKVTRHQTRWVCSLVYEGGDFCEVMPLNNFAPVVMIMKKTGDMPSSDELANQAFEVEILPESMVPGLEMPIFVKFVKLLGNRFDPNGEIAIASAEHDIPVEFSPAALAEAQKLPDEVDARSMKNRVDLRDIPFVTIDGEDARDFDDAVFAQKLEDGRWRLLVAIADVSHYVRPGSSLDVDAQQRGTSVYFPTSVIPMLPVKLSNGLCSLNPGVDRLTMVCDALVNEKGETDAYQFYPAVIHSHARLTYTQVWDALQGGAGGKAALGERLEDIRTLYELFKALRAARKERHTLDFETKETQAVFDEAGKISGFKVREHNDAHRLIEECMLVANVCAADMVTLKKRDTLFRVHAGPEADRVRTLQVILRNFGERLKDTSPESFAELIERTRDNEFLQTAILRTMSRACYTPQNIGHYGLQYEKYAHFTSPIRRYPDLLLHRTIKGILARRVFVPQIAFDDSSVMVGRHARLLGSRPEEKKGKPEGRNEARKAVWSRLGIICSAAERRADDASRDVMNYLKCQYMLDQGEKQYGAVITGMIPAGIFISLNNLAVEGFVHISKLGYGYFEFDESNMTMSSREEMRTYRIGDEVEVRLEEVDLYSRRLSFSIVSRARTRKRRR